MNIPDEMDITAYLQTEGRRLAAELAAAASAAAAANAAPRPLQADADVGLASPKSLSEVLQGMGVVRKPALRQLKQSKPKSPSAAAAMAPESQSWTHPQKL